MEINADVRVLRTMRRLLNLMPFYFMTVLLAELIFHILPSRAGR
jgi:hypothetical protein